MTKKTKALIVGISDHEPLGMGGDDLNGAVNDAMEMSRILPRCGFDPRGIVRLTDAEASRDRLLSELNWLVKNNKPGDSIVFFFAGHGATVTDADSDERIPPDEAICAFDEYILDDELNEIFRKVGPRVNVEVILDCCYAAGVLRTMLAMPDKPDPFAKIRAMVPVPRRRPRGSRVPGKRPKHRLPPGSRLIEVDSNKTLWSACSEGGNAEERRFGGKVLGVMTYHFASILEDSNGRIPRARVEELLVDRVQNTVPTQIPELDTSTTRRSRNIFA